MIYSLFTDEYGVLAFMDQYLDVLISTKGDILIDDREELDAAYRSGEFTEDEYKAALNEGNAIIDEWGKDIRKSDLICKEILKYARKYAHDHPLTVFLDIDGVLNIFQPDEEVQNILPSAGRNICDLIQRMKANLVIISNHRLGSATYDTVSDLFKQNGIDFDITTFGDEYRSRAEEKNAYLHMHPNIERYVILDDCFQDNYSATKNCGSILSLLTL